MKTLITSLFLISINCYGQLIYTDNFDAVYPYPSNVAGSATYNLDLNNDLLPDVKLVLNYNSTSFNLACGNTNGTGWVTSSFQGAANTIGQNKVNAPSSSSAIGIDCTNDTLNVNDLWNNTSKIYQGFYNLQSLCLDMGIGNHKQGFRLLLNNPSNGTLGYKYGYIDYTISATGDVIIHGWYYEDTFNVPIVANSLLDYPYNGNCIHYDTLTTIVYDTLTTIIYDTIFTSVTDTLLINTTLNSPIPNNTNTISIYPNPTNDHITIDNGNYLLMSNHSIKINNSVGQTVFLSTINQQSFYIDITNWSGNGVYYLEILDNNSVVIQSRKIILN